MPTTRSTPSGNGFNADPDRHKAALDLYETYAESYPDFHSAHYQLGLAFKANDMIAEARKSLDRAIEIHPYYPDAKKQIETLP